MNDFKSYHIFISSTDSKNTFDQLKDYRFTSFRWTKNIEKKIPLSAHESCQFMHVIGVSPKRIAIVHELPEQMLTYFIMMDSFDAILHIKSENDEKSISRAKWIFSQYDLFKTSIGSSANGTMNMLLSLDGDDSSELREILQFNLDHMAKVCGTFDSQRDLIQDMFLKDVLIYKKSKKHT
jgi:hypothetical protein